MGEVTLLDRVKNLIASIGWRLFIFGIGLTEDEYFTRIYEQEKEFKNSNLARVSGNKVAVCKCEQYHYGVSNTDDTYTCITCGGLIKQTDR